MSDHRLPVAFLSCVLLFAGCDRTHQVPAGPAAPASSTTPIPAPTPTVPPTGFWEAAMTVLSVTGDQGACRYGGTPVGATTPAVGWSIAVDADSISLDENVRNAPTDDTLYTGSLNGLQFSATSTAPTSGPSVLCPFRAATLSGSFNSDFSRFDATETAVWGTPGAEMTIQGHWVGLRR